MCPWPTCSAVYDALWAAGEAHGIGNFGSYALNAMRLEKGFKGASELTNEVTLPEADVMRFCKLDKGEFIGRDATVKSQEGERPWTCVYMDIDAEDADCLGSETVYLNGRRVGAISSGGYGHWVGRSLAFAYVEPQCAAPGTELSVAVLNTRRAARVLAEPVYDPASEKPRS